MIIRHRTLVRVQWNSPSRKNPAGFESWCRQGKGDADTAPLEVARPMGARKRDRHPQTDGGGQRSRNAPNNPLHRMQRESGEPRGKAEELMQLISLTLHTNIAQAEYASIRSLPPWHPEKQNLRHDYCNTWARLFVQLTNKSDAMTLTKSIGHLKSPYGIEKDDNGRYNQDLHLYRGSLNYSIIGWVYTVG